MCKVTVTKPTGWTYTYETRIRFELVLASLEEVEWLP